MKYLDQPFKTKNKIAYLTQDNFLPKNITVKQVVEIYSDDLDQKGFLEDEVLSKVIGTKIRNLSGGESRYLEVKLLLTLIHYLYFWTNHLMGFLLFILRLLKI